MRASSLQITLLVASLAFACLAHAADPTPPQPVDAHARPTPILEKGVIYVKGAIASASDTTTPLPENGQVLDGHYRNAYFGLSFPLLSQWTEEPAGPPPSNSGSYVLTHFSTRERGTDRVKASVLVTAQDLFFSPVPLASPLEMLRSVRSHLSKNFKVESEPDEVELGGRHFARLVYSAPVAGLQWRLFATEVRCHALLFTVSGNDRKSLDAAARTVNGSAFAVDANVPPCVAGRARSVDVVDRTEPFLNDQHFNPIPVRIIIDAEGHVTHIHLLSAFPEQSQVILATLRQWRFKPYLRDGAPTAVETGVMFGRTPTVIRRRGRPERPLRHGDSPHG